MSQSLEPINFSRFSDLMILEPGYPELSSLSSQFKLLHPETSLDPSVFLYTKKAFISFPILNTIKTHKFLAQKGFKHYFPLTHYFSAIGPLYLNFTAFYPTIQMIGTDEQFEHWKKLINDFKVIGAYAQTELAHGSDVQSLETRAVFDESQKCFILNSPKTSSIKWWPGLLGITGTHAVLQARMHVKGKDHGIQTFIVQIRDTKTLKTIPGVEAGDIGQKFGLEMADNGYTKLTAVKVPLENLLMRYIKVTPEGDVIKNADDSASKLGYASMLNLRTILLKYFLSDALRAVLINFDQNLKKNKKNVKDTENLEEVHDFLRSISLISTYFLSTRKLMEIFAQMNNTLKTDLKKGLSIVKELHILNSGFKATTSWTLVRLIRQMVQKNPFGNLILKGISLCYADQLPSVTYEGDNSVLTQQTARELLNFVDNVEQQNKVRESNRFLMRVKKFLNHNAETGPYIKLNGSQDFKNKEIVEDILSLLVFMRIQRVRVRLGEDMATGVDMKLIWNLKRQKDFIEMTHLYISVINYFFAKEMLEKFNLDAETRKLVEGFVIIYSLNLLKENLNEILMNSILKEDGNLLGHVNDALKLRYDEMKGKVGQIRDQLYHKPEYLGSFDVLGKVEGLEEMEQKVFKHCSQNAKGLMGHVNHLSKL